MQTYQTTTKEERERVTGINNEKHGGQAQRMDIRSIASHLDRLGDMRIKQIRQRLLRAESLSGSD